MASRDSYLDKESHFEGRYSREVFETLLHAYRSTGVRILIYVVLGFLGRLLLLSNANLVGVWVDSFCRAPATCKPVPEVFASFDNIHFLYVLVGLSIAGFFCSIAFRVGFSRDSAEAVSRLYDEVTLRTSRLPMRFFDTNPAGRIVTRFSSDYGNVFRLFGGPLAELLSIIFDLVCMVILVSVASIYYLPIIVLIALCNYGVYRLNRNLLRYERRELSASRSPSIAHFAETSQGASTIRIFGRQLGFMSRFVQLNDRFQRQRVRASAAILTFSMQMSLLTGILLLITGLAGYKMAQQGMVSIGSIGVAFTFIVLSGTSIQMFFEWMAQFEEAMTGVERLNDYLRRPLEVGSRLPSWRSFPTAHPVYGTNEEENLKRQRLVAAPAAAVLVEGLWFRYSPDLPYVLKGIDVRIRAGEKIGIVGRTGSGKSSFVQALFHMYPFDKGRIAIDGRAPAETDLQLYRRAIALIAQEPTLFRGTLRENLDLSGIHSDQELTEALGRVGLGDWFEGRGAIGLKFAVEEKGRNLSAGERQLLCMARCLLQDAPVVILDEATSAVDPHSEEILVGATEKFFADRTQIIIAHRLSTLEKCDRVLWLHQGEVKMFDEASRVLPVFRSTQLN